MPMFKLLTFQPKSLDSMFPPPPQGNSLIGSKEIFYSGGNYMLYSSWSLSNGKAPLYGTITPSLSLSLSQY